MPDETPENPQPLDTEELKKWFDELKSLPDAAEEGADNPENAPVMEDDDGGQHDMGRALLFVREHAPDLRYIPKMNRWMSWKDGRWELPDTGAEIRAAVACAKRRIAQAKAANARIAAPEKEDIEEAKARAKEANAFASAKNIASMLAIAKHDKAMSLDTSRIDSNPLMLGVENGVVDLENMDFREARRQDYITKSAGCRFDPAAGCERWVRFLDTIFAGDADLIRYIQRFAGYSLSGLTVEHMFLFLYGKGRNGKSVLVNSLMDMLGSYAMRAPQSLFVQGKNDAEPTHEMSDIVGIRFAVAAEVAQKSSMSEDRIKSLTGGDSVKARKLYSDFFQFKPVAKLWMFGNHKPRIDGTDTGIWSRVKTIPFNVTIPPEEIDKDLPEKLRNELPGILNWCIAGWDAWKSEGMKNTPDAVNAASEEYREEEDALAGFIGQEIVMGGHTPSQKIFDRYLQWAAQSGIHKTLTMRGFNKALKERGHDLEKSDSIQIWRGLSLREI